VNCELTALLMALYCVFCRYLSTQKSL